MQVIELSQIALRHSGESCTQLNVNFCQFRKETRNNTAENFLQRKQNQFHRTLYMSAQLRSIISISKKEAKIPNCTLGR